MSKAFRWASVNSGVLPSVTAPAFLLVAAAAGFGPTPQDVMRRALDAHLKHRIEMLQVTATPMDSGTILYKLYVDPRVKSTHVNIISPNSMAGTRSVDNSKVLRTYFPAQDDILEQPSPQKFRTPTDKRMQLIQRNYKLSLTSGRQIAGRNTYMVEMRPIEPSVGMRRVFIDRERSTILASYLRDPATKTDFTLTTTLHVNYNPDNRASEFQLPPKKEVKKETTPIELSKFKDAAKKLGFAPRIPPNLPYGFEIVSKQIVGSEEKPFLAVRCSDGMTNINVYQWNVKTFGGESPMRNVKTKQDPYRITYYVDGDAPIGILNAIRDTFIARASSS